MNKPSRTKRKEITQSGLIPRPVFEPEARHEPPPPPHMKPHSYNDVTGATTGVFRIIAEGEDSNNERDDDNASTSAT